MMVNYIRLTGTDGLVKGESFLIKEGEVCLIGRSRKCNICLVKIKKYGELEADDEVSHTKFRTVNGKHLQIFFKNVNHIVLQDLSQNGTFLSGNRIQDQIVLKDLEETAKTLLIGLEERFRMEIVMEKELEKEKKASEFSKIQPKIATEEASQKKDLSPPKREKQKEESVHPDEFHILESQASAPSIHKESPIKSVSQRIQEKEEPKKELEAE